MRRVIMTIEALLNAGCTLTRNPTAILNSKGSGEIMALNVVFKDLQDCHLILQFDSKKCLTFADFADDTSGEQSQFFLQKLLKRQGIEFNVEFHYAK